MSVQQMQSIAEQSMCAIDYQWEIGHHRQMHEAYERSLKG